MKDARKWNSQTHIHYWWWDQWKQSVLKQKESHHEHDRRKSGKMPRETEFYTYRTPHRNCNNKYHLKRKSIVIRRRNSIYINNLDIKSFQFYCFFLKSSKKVRYAQFSSVLQSFVAKLPKNAKIYFEFKMIFVLRCFLAFNSGIIPCKIFQ